MQLVDLIGDLVHVELLDTVPEVRGHVAPVQLRHVQPVEGEPVGTARDS